ncbi:MAG: hypothetical protein IT537_27670 [Hyphomicrobiales bacterium]|nr:hypothetical protein [Hyphomicrobiales bacterium]
MGYDGPERRAPSAPATPVAPQITVATVLGWLQRFWYVVAILTVLGVLAGLAAGTLIKPRFTS